MQLIRSFREGIDVFKGEWKEFEILVGLSGTTAKFKMSFSVAAFMVPVVDFVEQYLFNDWEFLASMMTLIILDTCLGTYRNLKQRTLSSLNFGKVLRKIILYSTLLIVTHVFRHFKVHGVEVHFFTWMDYFMYSAIMVKELISILEHISSIHPGLVPPWIIGRLKQFRETGKMDIPKNG